MNDIFQKSLLLIDGGLGTTLEDEHGIRFSSKTPLWSSHLLIESPEILEKVQHDFAEAGADIIITATYQASYEGFKKTGIDREKAKTLMQSAVTISRNAFNRKPGLVALGLGAYGAVMIPSTEYTGAYGSMTSENLVDFHYDRLWTFVDSPIWSDVDLIAFETIPRLDEIIAVREVMERVRSKPYWISCVFPNDDRLPDGSLIVEIVRSLLEGSYPPFAVGLNCTKMRKVPVLIRKFEEAAEKVKLELPRLVVYPDGAGDLVYDSTSHEWIGKGEEDSPWDRTLYQTIQEIQKRGKWEGILVGGCCKTTPRHIKRLRMLLDNKNDSP